MQLLCWTFGQALGQLLLALAVAVPFALGWLAGLVVVAYWWTVAAIVDGYTRGRRM